MSQRGWGVWLVTDVYPPECGGSGWSTHALARTLASRGHRVEVIAVDPAHADVMTRRFEGIAVTEIGVRQARRSPSARLGARDYAYGLLASYLARRLADDPDVDILHAQHQHSGPPAIAVGRRYGRATLVTVRDYWPVCLHGTSWWGDAVCDGCTTAGLAGCMAEQFRWPRPIARLMVGWARRRLAARKHAVTDAHRVLAVSEAVRQRIAGELPDARLTVVPNMVDPAHLEAVASAAGAPATGVPYLLTAGKLIPTKGFERLLTTLADVGSQVPIVVAGDGPLREALEQQASALGLDVNFPGWVAHDALLALQKQALAVVVPSAWNEPLSRLILETLGLGTPVIAWASGGTPEILDSGVNGWIVSRPDDLAAALRELESHERRRQVGLAGRARITTHYAADVVYPVLHDIYAETLREVGRR